MAVSPAVRSTGRPPPGLTALDISVLLAERTSRLREILMGSDGTPPDGGAHETHMTISPEVPPYEHRLRVRIIRRHPIVSTRFDRFQDVMG
ncbi:MAG: hypothetical protein DI630_23355 [Gordonia sp. (in: high G+C Gram-positive bacteria)]|nr:MAG: hypothetical protein DI630_23355 [Gordonia sp. (in: high G+C Gram-positive bacteria)]